MIVGKSIEVNGNLSALYEGKVQILKTFTVFSGYACLFSTLILCLYYILNDANLCKQTVCENKHIIGRWMSFFENHTFVCSFLTIAILYLPYIVMSYPGILQGDAEDFIAIGFNLPDRQSNLLVLLDENVYMNAHHPLIYTMFTHVCLILGKGVFKSYNVGIFMIVFSQFLFAIIVVSYFVQFLKQIKINTNWCIAVLMYYCLSPRMVSYMFLLSKDVFYAYIFLMLIILFSKLVIFNMPIFVRNTNSNKVEQREPSQIDWKIIMLISLIICLGVLFRNEAKYVFGVWLFICFLKFKKFRKMLVCGIVADCLAKRTLVPYSADSVGHNHRTLRA